MQPQGVPAAARADLTGSQLRALGPAELARIGDEGLRGHLVETAIRSHVAYAPVEGDNLASLLGDRELVRHPVRLAYELGTMASHQFAQPEPEQDGVVLYLHPSLKSRPRDTALAVAYFLPVVNYGQLITDDHCLIYGATLLGLTIEQYYAELCRMTDRIGIAPQPLSSLASP